ADNQAIRVGMPDPVLTYTTEQQSAGRGLLDGETLTGMLGRAPGVSISNYTIGPGTLVEANNSNYAIDFVEGVFTIEASPEIASAQHVSQLPQQAPESGTNGALPHQASAGGAQTAASGDLQFVEATSSADDGNADATLAS